MQITSLFKFHSFTHSFVKHLLSAHPVLCHGEHDGQIAALAELTVCQRVRLRNTPTYRVLGDRKKGPLGLGVHFYNQCMSI